MPKTISAADTLGTEKVSKLMVKFAMVAALLICHSNDSMRMISNCYFTS